VVLKQGGPNWRYSAEVPTLKYYEGRGAVRVFEEAAEDKAYLMQAARPGRQLATLYHAGKDDKATRIVATLIKTLLTDRPSTFPDLPPVNDLLSLFKKFKDADHSGASDPVREMIADGERAFEAMLAEPFQPVVLHGDLHHFNVLEHEGEWLAIDPHGYIGPSIFEVGAMMKNPWPDILDNPDMAALMTRRINILSEELGWTKADITRSAFVYACISLLWDFKFDDKPGSFVPIAACLHKLLP
jgi:streptomycin 6-kinase